MACPENNGDIHSKAPQSNLIGTELSDTNNRTSDISLYDASCTWSSTSASSQCLILNGISLRFEKGIFVAVIGEVNPFFPMFTSNVEIVNGNE